MGGPPWGGMRPIHAGGAGRGKGGKVGREVRREA